MERRGSVSCICVGCLRKTLRILSIYVLCGLRFEPGTSTPAYAVVTSHKFRRQFELCKSRKWVQAYTEESIWNPNSNIPEPDRPQHDATDTCAFAQQYSSSNFISLRFRLTQESIWRTLNKFCFIFINFSKNYVSGIAYAYERLQFRIQPRPDLRPSHLRTTAVVTKIFLRKHQFKLLHDGPRKSSLDP